MDTSFQNKEGRGHPPQAEDRGFSQDNPDEEVSILLQVFQTYFSPPFFQLSGRNMSFIHRNGARARKMLAPPPLPEDPMPPELKKLLTKDPYEVLIKKKGKKKDMTKSLSSHNSSLDPTTEEEESEEPSSRGWKRAASDETEEISPPQTFKRPRRAHVTLTGQTSAPVETIGSSSSEDNPHPRESLEAKR